MEDKVIYIKNLLVAHHQDLKFLDIVHQELLEASGQHVLGLLVATITDVGHQHLALEPPADPVVNTSGLSPVFLLETWESLLMKTWQMKNGVQLGKV